jgi:DnaJ-class molecular chaperone
MIDDDDGTYADPLEPDEPCPTCKGRGTINPLTAPAGTFVVGTTTCPDCDGTGIFDW